MKKPERTYRIYLSLRLATSHLCWALHGEGPHCLNASNHHGISWPNGLQQKETSMSPPCSSAVGPVRGIQHIKIKEPTQGLGTSALDLRVPSLQSWFYKANQNKNQTHNQSTAITATTFQIYKYWIFDISTQITHAPYEGYRRVASKFDRKSGDCQLSRMLRTLVCVSAWWKTAVKNLGELVGEQI